MSSRFLRINLTSQICQLTGALIHFFKSLEDINPFCGTTDTLVLDFWWRLAWVLKARVDSLVCMLCHLHATYYSDSPLVRPLLTPWRPSRFDPHFEHWCLSIWFALMSADDYRDKVNLCCLRWRLAIAGICLHIHVTTTFTVCTWLKHGKVLA